MSHYYQAPYQGYYPPPKKKVVWPWVLLAIGILFVATVGGCALFVGGAAVSSVNELTSDSKTYRYTVDGDASDALITFTDRDLQISQLSGQSTPWFKDVTLTGIMDTASVTVTNGIYDDGTVTCRIWLNGKVVTEQTASGPGASAFCRGK